MSNFDLLRAVQPEEGWFALVGIGDTGVRQFLVETREEADKTIAKLVSEKQNVFFGVAKFTDGESRKKSNVRALKAIWVDIDCGPDKAKKNPKTGRPDGYASQAKALVALKQFVSIVGLAKPIIVNSGRGLHVYWPLEQEVSPAEWQVVANRLRELCEIHDLYADPACFEPARVLRVPGTSNYKGEEPAPVSVMQVGGATDFAELKELLGVKESLIENLPRAELSPLAQQLQDNLEASFSAIMKRGENGCAQLNDCFINRASLAEPRWFSALSIAKFCKDRDKAIHLLSADHPDYDPDKTEQKLTHIAGPHRCETFEAQNPGGCDGCPHRGKIGSPISLGKQLVTATEEDNVVVEEVDDSTTQAPIVHTIPEYPFPFVRGKHGGIYKMADKDAEDQTPKLVYGDDLYIARRMRDPTKGEVALVKLHTPMDGVKEFVITNEAMMADRKEMLKALAREGVSMYGPKKTDLLTQYMSLSFEDLRRKKKVEHMRTQYGWTDNYSKFVVGNREITAQGVFYSPPSSLTEELTDNFTSAGSFDKWKEVFDIYGRPGFEAHAFAAAMAFASPLFHMSGHRGALVSLMSPETGTGKTTILHMCNSVWGHPEYLCAKADDTFNSKVHKIGVYNSIPSTFDEMTNTPEMELSRLAYLITQGEGKDRMKGASNELRKNLAKWRTVALCSSNSSFYQKLKSLKDSPAGELARIIELEIKDVEGPGALDVSYAKNMFDHQLRENYGHAGPAYIEYVVANYEEVKDLFKSTQGIVDAELKLTPKERFWSGLCTSVSTAMLLMRRLELCSWDIGRINRWMRPMINNVRSQTSTPLDNDLNVLGDFINRHSQHLLIVNDGADRRSNLKEAPLLEPRFDTKIRYEPDTKRLYIVAGAFRKDCTASQINATATLAKLEKRGLYLGSDAKRMNKGTRVNSLPVQALIFDGGHSDFTDLEEFAGLEAKTESAGESVGS